MIRSVSLNGFASIDHSRGQKPWASAFRLISRNSLASGSARLTIDANFAIQAAVVFLFGILSVGCDRPTVNPSKEQSKEQGKQEDKSKKSESTTTPQSSFAARTMLETCIGKYKNLKSYEDLGFLTIRIPTTDPLAPIVFREPTRVAFEAPNRLAIQFKALSAAWSSNATTFEAVVEKNGFKPFSNQRLVRPLPDAFDLQWLIVDNLGAVLNDEITGAPIQLQLLFDPKPLAYFLGPEATIVSLEPKEFDAIKCERVQVTFKDLKWVFWIDKETQLLRKYEMPTQGIAVMAPSLPPNFLPKDFDPNQSEFAVELSSAKANQNVDWKPWQIPNQRDDLAVRRFILEPPRNTPKLLGQKIAPFDLLGPDGGRILDSAQRTKTISVLCWVTNDEIGEQFVKVLFDVQREFEKRLLSKAEIILVTQANGSAMQESLKKWGCTLPLALDTQSLAQKSFSIQRQPAIVVLDKDVRVQHVDDLGYLNALPDIVENLQRGVDIANRRLQIALDDEGRFNSRLHRAIVDKAQTEKLPPIGPFPFFAHGLKENWRESFRDSIVAASGEHFYPQVGKQNEVGGPFAANAKRQRVMTILDDRGHVYAIDNAGTKTWIASIPTDQMDNPKRIHILPDPWTHRWIAIVPEGLPRYWLIDTAANADGDPIEASQFDLDDKEDSPVAFVWAVKDGEPVLAIATVGAKLEVLYPPKERFVSDVTGKISAIVPTLNDLGQSEGWNLIKSNGDIQEIEPLRSIKLANNSVPSTQPKRLTFQPSASPWGWGRNGNQGVLLGMSQLPSGEAGTILQSRLFEPRTRHALSVRPEQCRILSTTTLADGAMVWLSTAPNRVLHLNTADNFAADQMSLGTRIFGAGIFPDSANLRMVLAVDKEVNCWTIEVPRAPPTTAPNDSPASNEKEAISPSENSRG